ncbi:hypothetical protein WH47_00006, partial [Habropoda laboriosa]
EKVSLQRNNARSYTVHETLGKIEELVLERLIHLSYSLDAVPSDHHLFQSP